MLAEDRDALEVARRLAGTLLLLAEPKRLAMLLVLAESRAEIGSGDLSAAVGLRHEASTKYSRPLILGELMARRREGQRQFYALTDSGRVVVEAVRRLIG